MGENGGPNETEMRSVHVDRMIYSEEMNRNEGLFSQEVMSGYSCQRIQEISRPSTLLIII